VIVCGLLVVLTGLLDALFGLLPAWEWTLADVPTLGTEMSAWDQTGVSGEGSSLTTPFLLMARANRFVPIDHFLYAMQFLALVVGAVLIFRGIKFIINVIRGAGA